MYRGVLVTLDGSPLSEAVLPVVADFAAGTGTAVTHLTVGEVPEATVRRPRQRVRPYTLLTSAPALRLASTTPRYVETKTQAIERKEESLQAYFEDNAAGLRARVIEARTAVRFGNPTERIVEYTRREEQAHTEG